MFKQLIFERNVVRGSHLLQEFNDARFRIEGFEEQHSVSCARHMVTGFRTIQDTFGPLTTISNTVKTELARILREEAKNNLDSDLGKGYGIVLLSLYLESATLPGDDAKYVHDYLNRFLVAP